MIRPKVDAANTMTRALSCFVAALNLVGCASTAESVERNDGSTNTASAKPPAKLSASAPKTTPSTSTTMPPASPSSAASSKCAAPSLDFKPTGDFNHSRSKLAAKAGEPRHVGVDQLSNPGESTKLRAKFSYGAVRKDLEDETVVFFTRSEPACSYTEVGRTETNDEGWAEVELKSAPLGIHEVLAVVAADGSRAQATLFTIAPKTKAVVFDVDATLTTSDAEVFEEVLAGKIPDMRPDADKVVNAYAKAGFFVVYLTGRPTALRQKSKDWLAAKGFPESFLRVTDHVREAMPTEDGVQKFKQRALDTMKAQGLDFVQAYGNAPTDICAYAHAGIPAEKTFILGRHGGEGCGQSAKTVALESYTAQLPKLPSLLSKP